MGMFSGILLAVMSSLVPMAVFFALAVVLSRWRSHRRTTATLRSFLELLLRPPCPKGKGTASKGSECAAVLARLHPDLRKEVEPPVLEALQAAVAEQLGKVKGIPWRGVRSGSQVRAEQLLKKVVAVVTFERDPAVEVELCTVEPMYPEEGSVSDREIVVGPGRSPEPVVTSFHLRPSTVELNVATHLRPEAYTAKAEALLEL
eukprot:RCo003149